MTQKYRVLRRDRAAVEVPETTVFVFECAGYDFGCAADDTLLLEMAHISVTFDPTGAYPFFTIPLCDLEVVK